jgi:DNA-binding Lrp family transcriptional regulator
MTDLPTTRQDLILSWLQEQPALTIDELVKRLDVSAMTVHRDIDALVERGLVEKVRGAVKRGRVIAQGSTACRLCDVSVSPRALFTIQCEDGSHVHACCPHCGLLLVNDLRGVALARDFLFGRMVNAMQAVYLVESDVVLCCQPSVLCFSSQVDALKFQRGFGGSVMDYDAARALLAAQHSPR